MGLVAKYGHEECILSFRGSKTLLNYLYDDFDYAWTKPYQSCQDCTVHIGFYRSWQSLRDELVIEAKTLGCDNKPLRVTGHSLGAAMAALAAFDLADNFTLKHVYTYGQPRVGNAAWVHAFERRLLKVPYFRVVDYMDAVPHLPPRGFIFKDPLNRSSGDEHDASLIAKNIATSHSGYQHPGPEVFYNATKMGAYRTCQAGEDPSCSDQFSVVECLLHTCCHCSYLGLNPCDGNTSMPQCIQPKDTHFVDSLRASGGQGQIVV
jgi:hypothetical protein